MSADQQESKSIAACSLLFSHSNVQEEFVQTIVHINHFILLSVYIDARMRIGSDIS